MKIISSLFSKWRSSGWRGRWFRWECGCVFGLGRGWGCRCRCRCVFGWGCRFSFLYYFFLVHHLHFFSSKFSIFPNIPLKKKGKYFNIKFIKYYLRKTTKLTKFCSIFGFIIDSDIWMLSFCGSNIVIHMPIAYARWMSGALSESDQIFSKIREIYVELSSILSNNFLLHLETCFDLFHK